MDEGLATATLDGLSLAIEQLAAAQMAVLARLLDMVAEYDRRQGWRTDGMASMADWLAARLSVSRATAQAWTAAAARLAELPQLRAAAAAGNLSWDQLQPILHLARPETEAMWATDGPAIGPAQLRLMARRARPLTPQDDATAHARRSLRTRWHRDGMLGLTARLTSDAGATVMAALHRIALQDHPTAEQAGEPPDELRPSWTQRQADALLHLASTRLAADLDADAAAIVVHTSAAVLAGQEGNADIEAGPVISGATLRRMACDSRIRWVLYDHNGAVSVTEARATIPRWLRRLVKARDLTCRFPGCERRAFGQVHHIVWRSRGGQTQMDTLAYLCWQHHHAVHEGGWTVTGNADHQLTFTSPNGHPYPSRPAGLNRQTTARLFGPDYNPRTPPSRPPPPPSRN